MDHLEQGFVGLERSLMVKTKTLDRWVQRLDIVKVVVSLWPSAERFLFTASRPWSRRAFVFLTARYNTNTFLFLLLYSLTKEYAEASKKMKDSSVGSDKKTFLKAQMPKMEKEIAELKAKLVDLLAADELDPRGEFYVLAQKLTK